MRPRSLAAAVAIAGMLAVSCGSEDVTSEARPAPEPALPSIPDGAMPGAAADPVALDLASLAAEITSVDELRTLLVQAGFVGGTERTFSRTIPGRRRTDVQVLAFETRAGAERYLRWLEDHAVEMIGKAQPDPTLEVPRGGVVFVHEPNPCCHNDTRIVLAAWVEGATVITLEIAGPAARRGDAPRLIERLENAIA